MNINQTILPIKKREKVPVDLESTPYKRFVGKHDNILPLNHLRGMSGGPIIGIQYGPQTRYWLLAIQSGWRKKQSIIYGTTMSDIADIFYAAMNERAA